MTVECRVPPQLADRLRDTQGRVLGWVLGHDADGNAMQGTNDATLVAQAILERLCGLCGQPLGYWITFIGDEECVRGRVFTEPPMHEDCARYALAACPFLRAEEGFAVKRDRDGVVTMTDRHRPARMALYLTRDFAFFPPPRPPVIPAAKADAPKRVEWF